METPSASLLPRHCHLLECGFEAPGEGLSTNCQSWIASMEAPSAASIAKSSRLPAFHLGQFYLPRRKRRVAQRLRPGGSIIHTFTTRRRSSVQMNNR